MPDTPGSWGADLSCSSQATLVALSDALLRCALGRGRPRGGYLKVAACASLHLFPVSLTVSLIPRLPPFLARFLSHPSPLWPTLCSCQILPLE